MVGGKTQKKKEKFILLDSNILINSVLIFQQYKIEVIYPIRTGTEHRFFQSKHFFFCVVSDDQEIFYIPRGIRSSDVFLHTIL